MSHSVHLLLGVFWLLIVANWQNTAQYMSPVSRVFIHSGHLPSGAGCVRLSKLFAPPRVLCDHICPPCYLLIPSNNTCPDNFIFEQHSGVAETMKDLKGVGDLDWECYGKNLGRCI